MMIIVAIISFLAGSFVGMMLTALLTANKRGEEDE